MTALSLHRHLRLQPGPLSSVRTSLLQVLTELLKYPVQMAPVQRKALDLVADLAGRGIELQVSHGRQHLVMVIMLLLPDVLLDPAAMFHHPPFCPHPQGNLATFTRQTKL